MKTVLAGGCSVLFVLFGSAYKLLNHSVVHEQAKNSSASSLKFLSVLWQDQEESAYESKEAWFQE